MNPFADIALAPRDPILGLNEQFNADTRSAKVNLGVGVYTDAEGKLPLLSCVAAAEAQLVAAAKPRGYLPIDGIAAYDRAVQELVFGADSPLLRDKRVATVQAVGGTGGLKLGADFLRSVAGPGTKLLISDPSWENHRALFSQAGYAVESYPYFDSVTKGVRFEALCEALRQAPRGSIVVLHACCHNPTGCELSPTQWKTLVALAQQAGLLPFLDMAYQGFGDGIEADGLAVRLFAESGLPFLVATSFSKSFSLYGERVGALSVVCGSADEAARVLSQLKIVIRTNYSTPPTHGAQIVATVLGTPALRAQWEAELGQMRERIREMRSALAAKLAALQMPGDLSFITRQKGMFSFTGLSAAQMQRLRTEFAVYGVDSGRICVAALNHRNLDAVAQAMATVARS
jgi:aromatic-amino-acid transaminase